MTRLACWQWEESDQHKVKFLQKHCGEEGFCLYLAQLGSTVAEDEPTTFKLNSTVNLDGSILIRDVDLDEKSLIQVDWFEDRDSEEGEIHCWHTGCDECYCDRHFEDTVCYEVFTFPLALHASSDKRSSHSST